MVRLIGEGSFGKVYLAIHKFTRTKVVLKSSPKIQPHLVREIHHHRQLRHPHIARLYEIIVTESTVWLVLEYCPGDELYTYLLNHGRLGRDEACKIFSQLVGAVTYTHSKNCTHRDLKLENILLDKRFNVKLCDFGFTREYEPRSLLDTVCGTTCYMAPEMLLHKKYSGEAVDVWSLGVIFYTLLLGEMPFEEDSEIDTKVKITTEEPRYLGADTLNPSCLELLRSMLQKDPKKRPSLTEIMNHPCLEDHTSIQKEILAVKEPALFTTKAEKRVLRGLRSAHVDLDALADSVVSNNCDALAGFWALALERERRAESRRTNRMSLSKYSGLGRRDSSRATSRQNSLARRGSSAQRMRDNISATIAAASDGLALNDSNTRDESNQSAQKSPRSPYARYSSPIPRSSSERPDRDDRTQKRKDDGQQARDRAEQIERPKLQSQQPSEENSRQRPLSEIPISQTSPQRPQHEYRLSLAAVERAPSAPSSVTSAFSRGKRSLHLGDKGREMKNSFKNVMMKMIAPQHKKAAKSNPVSGPIQTSSPKKEGPPPPSTQYVPNGDPKADTAEQDYVDLSLDFSAGSPHNHGRIGSRPESARPSHLRPVSQISQVSQFSQYSMSSQVSSAAVSQASQNDKSTVPTRPHYGRRSTSSSFSSLVSRSRRRRRNHSKTSSTSSASLNSSPKSSWRGPDSPTVGYQFSKHSYSPLHHRRQLSGPRGKFNESAVFGGPARGRFRRKSPFGGPISRPESERGLRARSKGSVIEEGDENLDYLEIWDETVESQDKSTEDRGRTM